MQLIKLKQSLTVFIIIIIVLAFSFLLLGSALTGKLFSGATYVFVLTGAFFGALIHGTIYATKRTLGAKEENIKISEKNQDVFYAAGQAINAWQMVKIIFGTIISLVIVGFAVFVGIGNLKGSPLVFDVNSIWLASGFVGYFILVFPFIRIIGKSVSSIVPTYDLLHNGLVINPKIGGKKDLRFKIDFAEIDEMREMNFQEAELYYENLGPNIKLAWEEIKGLYSMGKENKRPKIYIQNQSFGKTILMRGKNFLYLITLSNDTSDLMTAYKNFKASKNA